MSHSDDERRPSFPFFHQDRDSSPSFPWASAMSDRRPSFMPFGRVSFPKPSQGGNDRALPWIHAQSPMTSPFAPSFPVDQQSSRGPWSYGQQNSPFSFGRFPPAVNFGSPMSSSPSPLLMMMMQRMSQSQGAQPMPQPVSNSDDYDYDYEEDTSSSPSLPLAAVVQSTMASHTAQAPKPHVEIDFKGPATVPVSEDRSRTSTSSKEMVPKDQISYRSAP